MSRSYYCNPTNIMADSYVPLWSSIVDSTIWREALHVKVLWITMLAKADAAGNVYASMPGLADSARVTLEQCLEGLDRLASPDEWSRTKEYEGRRIEAIDGGWKILNFDKHRLGEAHAARRAQVKAAVRRHRQKQQQSEANGNPDVITGDYTRLPVIEVSPEAVAVSALTTTTLSDSPSDVVLKHYLAVHPRRRIGDKDRRAVSRALKMGYTPGELCEAIDGNAHDAWHKERHKHELPYVLRDTGHIDDARAKGEIGDLGSLVVAGDMSPELERLTRPRSV